MLGEALRLIRVFHDKKSTTLAQELGISTAYLSKIEKGKAEASIELIKKYAQIFQTSPSALLFFSEKLDNKFKRSPFKIAVRNKMLYLLEAIESLSYDGEEKNPNKSESIL